MTDQIMIDENIITAYVEENPAIITKIVETTKAGQNFLQAEKDRHFNKSLETWKENNLQKLVNEKVEELYPKPSPEEQELAEYRKKVEELQHKAALLELNESKRKVIEDTGLSKDLMTFLHGNNEAELMQSAKILNEIINENIDQKVQAKVIERFKMSSFEPMGGNN